MKKTAILIAIFISTYCSSEESDQKITETKDSYTIQRLIIENDKGEILIYKGKHNWMTPALRHNKDLSIRDGLQELALSYGLIITRPKLSGLFTYKFGFKQGVSFRSFYKATLLGNDKVTPPAPITEVKWVASAEVINAVSGIKVRINMLKQVLDFPNTVWGGSFYLYDDSDGRRKSKILEDFYPLN